MKAGARNASVSLFAECFGDKWLFGWVFSIAAFVNFVHLTNFSLSIDEELASFATGSWKVWVAQGRWGMGLVNLALPDYAPIPFISTFIFIVCITASALLFSKTIVSNRAEALVFGGVLVSSPIWLQISEFNTLAAGVGIGLLLTAAAMHLVRTYGVLTAVCAGLCVGFSVAIYQALIVVYVVGCLAVLFPFNYFWADGRDQPAWDGMGTVYMMIVSLVVAGAFYVVMQWLLLTATRQHIVYIGTFNQLAELRSSFDAAAKRIYDEFVGVALGTSGIYLGWGRVLLTLPIVGFLYGLYKTVTRARFSPGRSIRSAATLIAIVACCSGLIVLATGRIPVRALIGFPFLFALLAVNAYRMGGALLRWPYWSFFAYVVLISGWIGASLFYSDRVARVRDRVLATHLISAIYGVAHPAVGDHIPMVIVGERSFPDQGVARHVQVFGQSFFAQDGGNPYRIAAYLKYMGVEGLSPAPITDLGEYRSQLENMPAWPAHGSVAMVDQTLVVKLGPISYQQNLLLDQRRFR